MFVLTFMRVPVDVVEAPVRFDDPPVQVRAGLLASAAGAATKEALDGSP
jgi:hypothetical protein